MKPWLKYLLLVSIAAAVNLNNLFNDYALDDCVVLTQNRFVQNGLAGIPAILNSDYAAGYTDKPGQLAAVRYRPLTLITFALEYHFFKLNPKVSHAINILLFVLLVVLLYRLFVAFFPFNPNAIWIGALVFAVHPIHAEVIANVKGRDELLAFLWIVLSLNWMLNPKQKHEPIAMLMACICFGLALLTKETAITFLGIIPLTFFYVKQYNPRKTLLKTFPFLLTTLLYVLIRFWLVGNKQYAVFDVANSPYLYASINQAFATKIWVVFKYLWMVLWPLHLSSDYGYNQIPYINVWDPYFLASSISLLILCYYIILAIPKRSYMAFSMVWFFITLSVGTNIFFDLGAPMADRMLFQPSWGYAIGLGFIAEKCFRHSRYLTGIFLLTLIGWYALKTVERNAQWKNNQVLFLADVQQAPNCARLNLFACEQLVIKANTEINPQLKKADLEKAIFYGKKAIAIHPKFAYAY